MTAKLENNRRCEMNIPGFDAEASLGPTLGMYRGKAVHSRISGGFVARLDAVKPQQLVGFGTTIADCFGSIDQCQNLCSHDTPHQKALCLTACKRLSVCEGCRCT